MELVALIIISGIILGPVILTELVIDLIYIIVK